MILAKKEKKRKLAVAESAINKAVVAEPLGDPIVVPQATLEKFWRLQN